MKGWGRAVDNVPIDVRSRVGGQGRLRRVGLLVLCGLLAGCSDPNVRKQKYFESGERYSSKGQYEKAASQYADALNIDPNYAAAHYSLARAYLHLRQTGPAYSEFVRTVDLQPANYQARLDLGNLLFVSGKIEKAQEQASAVMAAQPNNSDLHALLAAIAIKRGLKSQALAEIQRAMQLDPNRAAFHEDLALFEAEDPGRTAAVEDELRKSVLLDPESVNPRLLLAALYAGDGHWTEAEQTAQSAVSADPQSLSARESLAQIYSRHGNQAKAEEVLRQAASDFANSSPGVIVLADYYLRSGQPEKAKAEFAALAAKYPKNLSVQEGYVRALLQVKDFQTTQNVINKLKKSDGNDPRLVAMDGIALLNFGKADEAFFSLQKGARNYPKDAYIQYWLGRAALAKGDISQAKASFSQALALDPSRRDAQQQLAMTAVQTGDMAVLSDVADKSIAATPGFEDGYLWRATVEMSRNSLDRAEADLKTAMGIAPNSALPYLELGRIRLKQRRFPEAVVLFEQAMRNDPNCVEAMRLLVSYDLFQKHPGQALARLNAQIAKCPKNSTLLVFLARLQIESNNLDQAAATAQKAIQIDREDAEAVMLFAQILVQRGQTPNAVAAWEQWSNSHAGDAGALAILGTLEESRGDQAKAEAYYRKSLQIQPHQPLASNNLAYLMLQKGDDADIALSLAETARHAMPNSPDTAATLAWAYYHKAAYALARDLLEVAIAADANNATMQYHLGLVYGKLRDKNNAVIHLKRALSLAPASADAIEARAVLQGLG
jgi:tetratricopeptide (TPR) repeat protein